MSDGGEDEILSESKWWNRPIKPEGDIPPTALDVEILVAGDGYRFPKPGMTVGGPGRCSAFKTTRVAPTRAINWSAPERSPARNAAGCGRPDAQVAVQYVGYLPSGRVFDATYRRGAPFKFKLGSVPPASETTARFRRFEERRRRRRGVAATSPRPRRRGGATRLFRGRDAAIPPGARPNEDRRATRLFLRATSEVSRARARR